MTDAKTLAQYLLYLFKEQMDELQSEEFDVTPLKLQKLLYYCQGYALALTGKPLFPEPIEAWKYGPVVACVYQEYKDFKDGRIPYEYITPPENVDEVTASVARMVADEKGRLSGIVLAKATHKERPWRSTYNDAYTNVPMPVELLRESFLEMLKPRMEEGTDEEEERLWASASLPMTSEDWKIALEGI